MKKVSILLLALVLCGSLTACGDKSADSGKAENESAVQTVKHDKDSSSAAKPSKKDKKPSATDGKDNTQSAGQGKEEATETGDNTSRTEASDAVQQQPPAQSQAQTPVQTQSPSQTQTSSQTQPPVQTQAPTQTQSQPIQSQPQAAPAPEPVPEPAPQPSAPAPAPEPAKPTLSQASGYVGSSAAALESALGSPNSKAYSPSCMGEGEDGIWSYDGFTVYTYRENGNETVEAVQ